MIPLVFEVPLPVGLDDQGRVCLPPQLVPCQRTPNQGLYLYDPLFQLQVSPPGNHRPEPPLQRV